MVFRFDDTGYGDIYLSVRKNRISCDYNTHAFDSAYYSAKSSVIRRFGWNHLVCTMTALTSFRLNVNNEPTVTFTTSSGSRWAFVI